MSDAMPSLGKGKGLLIVAGGEDGGGDEGGDEREAFDAFADAAGIADDKRDDAYDAMQAFVEACVARAKGGEYGKDEEG